MNRKIATLILLMLLTAPWAGAKSLDTRISKLQFFGMDNSLVFEIHLFYDVKGNVVKSKEFDPYMRLVGMEEFVFNEKGVWTEEKLINSRRQLEKHTIIDYAEGKRIRKTYDRDYVLLMVTEDEYGSKGEIKSVTEYSVTGGNKGDVLSLSKYSYTGAGEIKCARSDRVSAWDYYYIIKLSEQGQIESVSYYNTSGQKTGFVKIVLEEGVMTPQSLNLIIY